MFLVDSSVWIDFFNGNDTPQTEFLDSCILEGQFLVGDLILVEVLQGTRTKAELDRILRVFSVVDQIAISNPAIAVKAARHYHFLREKGLTVRKTIDALIATRCIMSGIPLLYSDRDFDPFVEHLGLVDVMAEA